MSCLRSPELASRMQIFMPSSIVSYPHKGSSIPQNFGLGFLNLDFCLQLFDQIQKHACSSPKHARYIWSCIMSRDFVQSLHSSQFPISFSPTPRHENQSVETSCQISTALLPQIDNIRGLIKKNDHLLLGYPGLTLQHKSELLPSIFPWPKVVRT